MNGYIFPGPAAGYYMHGLGGYAPALLSAGSLPPAAFLSTGIDPLVAYAAATLPASMHTLSFDSPVTGAGIQNGDESNSDQSLTPTTSFSATIALDQTRQGGFSSPGYGKDALSGI